MASLDLTLFEKHFSEGKNFEITEEEYVNSVKKNFHKHSILKAVPLSHVKHVNLAIKFGWKSVSTVYWYLQKRGHNYGYCLHLDCCCILNSGLLYCEMVL